MHFVKGVFPDMFQKNEWEFFMGTIIGDGNSNARLPKWISADRTDIFSMFAQVFGMISQ